MSDNGPFSIFGGASPTAPPPSPGAPGGHLDPADWDAFRASLHQVVDEMVDRFQDEGTGPVWQAIPESVHQGFTGPLPRAPRPLDSVLDRVRRDVLPYTLGNTHPRFFGWVHGSGTPVGALAELLAASMNANTGGRHHAPILVEDQVVNWVRRLFDFPEEATGLVVSGTSMATVVGLAVARHRATRGLDRKEGLRDGPPLVGYTTRDGHQSIRDAFSLLGLGASALRAVPMLDDGSMDPVALERRITEDVHAGRKPFAVIATAGSVTCGAIDDLVRIREICRDHGLWMHVDAAFGAAARLSPQLAPRLDGIETADSIAFDFHKWFHVPYDAGFVLVRDGRLHTATFGGREDYLTSLGQGPGSGDIWPCDLGPELSRGFRAFKVWFTLQTLGADAIGEAVERNVRQARSLARMVDREPELERLGPADLNIVSFRYRSEGRGNAELNELNREILLEIQERGIALPSPIRRDEAFGIRVCLCNHRTRDSDLRLLVKAVLELGRSLVPVG